ncbi:hypothetical protein EV128_103263 [Rhizobium azibense]|nr:hypothetical protein EV128_103263 [Rhizobium azibense]
MNRLLILFRLLISCWWLNSCCGFDCVQEYISRGPHERDEDLLQQDFISALLMLPTPA